MDFGPLYFCTLLDMTLVDYGIYCLTLKVCYWIYKLLLATCPFFWFSTIIDSLRVGYAGYAKLFTCLLMRLLLPGLLLA